MRTVLRLDSRQTAASCERPPDDRFLQRPILHRAPTQQTIPSPRVHFRATILPSCDERGHRERVAVPREQERGLGAVGARRVLALSGARPGCEQGVTVWRAPVGSRRVFRLRLSSYRSGFSFLYFLQRRDCTPRA